MRNLGAQAFGEKCCGDTAMAAQRVGTAAAQRDRAALQQRGDRRNGALRIVQRDRAAGEGVTVAQGRQVEIHRAHQRGQRFLPPLRRLRGRRDAHIDERGAQRQHMLGYSRDTCKIGK